MEAMATVMQKLRERSMMSTSNSNETNKLGETKCPKCFGMEVVFSHKDDDGYEIYIPCVCRDRNAWGRRFKNALIPEEFVHANLENYQINDDNQREMFDLTAKYLESFPADRKALQKEGAKNFGFTATIGEQRIRALRPEDRSEIKHKHNNFGIGKTHLQIAMAKQLIKQGFNVFIVSDVTFMDEMMNAKRMNDDGETYNKMLSSVLKADVLVWDDIGKAKPTEAKEGLYYTIVNERYKRKQPIIFNTNEDKSTLADRIGYAANSRLLERGQGEYYVIETEGIDWRLKK
ncbi:ATP-binding protein [Psychrobacillus psychrotolerans]|uniref:ATP-binding protein n=1 Tax=Psychrobacillus psychrotolerans TaxID=126156 RepID=UPI003B0241E9